MTSLRAVQTENFQVSRCSKKLHHSLDNSETSLSLWFFSVRTHVRLCRASSSISSFQYHYTQVVLFLLGMECAFARHTIFRHFTSKADLFWESEWLLSSHQNSIGTVRKNTCATHSQRLGKPNLSLPGFLR